MILPTIFAHFYLIQVESGLIFGENTYPIIGGLSVLIAAIILYGVKSSSKSSDSSLLESIKNIQDQADDIGDIALEKIDGVLDEYQETLPYLAELGLKVEGLDVEVGLLPKVKTSLVASIEGIEVEAVEEIKKEHASNKLLISILNGVLLAKKMHERLEEASVSLFKDLVVDVTLGIPPAINVRFK